VAAAPREILVGACFPCDSRGEPGEAGYHPGGRVAERTKATVLNTVRRCACAPFAPHQRIPRPLELHRCKYSDPSRFSPSGATFELGAGNDCQVEPCGDNTEARIAGSCHVGSRLRSSSIPPRDTGTCSATRDHTIQIALQVEPGGRLLRSEGLPYESGEPRRQPSQRNNGAAEELPQHLGVEWPLRYRTSRLVGSFRRG